MAAYGSLPSKDNFVYRVILFLFLCQLKSLYAAGEKPSGQQVCFLLKQYHVFLDCVYREYVQGLETSAHQKLVRRFQHLSFAVMTKIVIKQPNLSFPVREDQSSHSSNALSRAPVERWTMSAYLSFQMPWFPTSPALLCSHLLYYFFICRRLEKGRQESFGGGELITKWLCGSCEWSDINVHENLQPLLALQRCLSKDHW